MNLKKTQFLNYSILIPYLILSILGLIIVYSTTSASLIEAGKNPFSSVFNQSMFWAVSLVAMFILYRMKLSFLRKNSVLSWAIVIEFCLLVATLIFGRETNGAKGWLPIFRGFSLQPAEYLKVIIVWYLSYKFARLQQEIAIYDYQSLTKNQWLPRAVNDWRAVSLVLILLDAIQPDFGNATIITLTVLIMVAVSGIASRWFYAIVATVVGASSLILGLIRVIGPNRVASIPMVGYIAKRFTAFFNPFKDLTDAGHQLANSYYAMSNGGWFGLGLGNSIEKKGYLPEAQTDFVFSIVIEELGLFGAILILVLLFFLILRIFLVGIRAKSPFNSMMALGIGGMLLMQAFVNIGGISGLIPSTGVTFPFLSQGGNSLLTISIAIGFVLNIDASEKHQEAMKQLA